MEKVIYNRGGGLGIILEAHEKESDFFGNDSFTILKTHLKKGDFTDLFGLFSEPVEYVGNLIYDKKCMVFSLGSDSDLFDTLTYYSCFYWIAENRLANKYSERTVRDFNWNVQKGEWE